MINLLPDADKNETQAARHNVLLLRYTGISLLATVALLGVMYLSHAILTDTKASAESIIESSTVEADVYNETKSKVSELTDKLAEVQLIMGQEVQFSSALTGIAELMPAGTVIKEVEIDASQINNPLTVTVFSKTTDALLELQSAFQSSPTFTNVDFQTIGDSDGSIDGYPTSVTMTIVLNRAGLNA